MTKREDVEVDDKNLLSAIVPFDDTHRAVYRAFLLCKFCKTASHMGV